MMLFSLVSCEPDPAEIPFEVADENFSRMLLERYDSDHNGVFTYEELTAITELNIKTDEIVDIGEIRKMPELISLICRGSRPGSGRLEHLDLSGNPKLTILNCDNNHIQSLDLSGTPKLQQLSVSCNPIRASLDVSSCPDLATLNATGCSYLEKIIVSADQFDWAKREVQINPGTTIVLDPNYDIPIPDANFKKYLITNFDTNGDGQISVFETDTITEIIVCTDDIQTLSGIRFFENLERLDCSGSGLVDQGPSSGKLTELDISYNKKIKYLRCSYNRLTYLDISKERRLETVYCDHNDLQSITILEAISLRTLDCSYNDLTDLSGLGLLMSLNCEHNHISSLDLSRCSWLHTLNCSGNDITVLDVSNNSNLKEIQCDNIPPFPDTNFQAMMLLYDRDGDGFISLAEASKIAAISVNTDDIATLSGLEWLVNLKYLCCVGSGYNGDGGEYGKLTALDLSKNHKLNHLICAYNHIRELDVSNNPYLLGLDCSANEITTLDISRNEQLKELDCHDNDLTSLVVDNNRFLQKLFCQGNGLHLLDVSKNPNLGTLNCATNKISSLSFAPSPSLWKVNCCDNLLSSLELIDFRCLESLLCSGNQLTLLDVSDALSLLELDCRRNPLLTEIRLKTGQTITSFLYDSDISIVYK